MDTIRKVIDCEVKKLDEYTYEFTASTETVDRQGEVIEASGWDLRNFKKNPVITWAHDYRALPIGRAPKVWVADGQLKNHVEFPEEGTYEFADIVRRLVDGGFLKAESVGFIPREWEDGQDEKDPRRAYKEQELLEIAIVPVPANPDALITARAKGIITEEELKLITKSEEIGDPEEKAAISYQAAHPDGTPKANEDYEWDAAREVREADVDDLKVMCALLLGDPENKTSYKLPHHTAKGHKLVWRGVTAAGAVLMGARGGVDAPEADKAGAKAHLAKHYREFDKEPPWEKGVSQGEIRDEIDYLLTTIKAEGLNEDCSELAWKLVDEIMRLSGGDMPVEIQAKVGAVLNQKNLGRLEKIKTLAQEVIDLAKREDDDGDKAGEPEITLDDVIEIVKGEVARAIDKARGKVN